MEGLLTDIYCHDRASNSRYFEELARRQLDQIKANAEKLRVSTPDGFLDALQTMWAKSSYGRLDVFWTLAFYGQLESGRMTRRERPLDTGLADMLQLLKGQLAIRYVTLRVEENYLPPLLETLVLGEPLESNGKPGISIARANRADQKGYCCRIATDPWFIPENPKHLLFAELDTGPTGQPLLRFGEEIVFDVQSTVQQPQYRAVLSQVLMGNDPNTGVFVWTAEQELNRIVELMTATPESSPSVIPT